MAATLNLREHLREHWEELKHGRPGRRFRDRYDRTHKKTARAVGTAMRIGLFVVALLCLAVAVVLSVIPGPAIPFFFVAGGLLASESRIIARVMDWFEVRARSLGGRAKRLWKTLPFFARIGLTVAGLCCSAGMAYLSYRFMMG